MYGSFKMFLDVFILELNLARMTNLKDHWLKVSVLGSDY